MLVEDSAAFVERLEVPAQGSDKHRRRAARAELEIQSGQWEVHLAASAALELERLIPREHSPRRVRILKRELGSIRRHLHAKREELEASMARLDRLEAKARADLARRQPHVMFRLHSAGRHVDCSEQRFGRLSATQLRRPVFVTKCDGRAWWWYLNRCWWDDDNLRSRELEDVVLRRDLERVFQADTRARARIAVLGEAAEADGGPAVPDSLHLSVWSRHRGRCVDCGSAERVNFDRIMATSRRSSETPRNFELRCQTCRDRRDHNEGRARVGSARVNAVPYPRFG
jgi:hypothetical protein